MKNLGREQLFHENLRVGATSSLMQLSCAHPHMHFYIIFSADSPFRHPEPHTPPPERES